MKKRKMKFMKLLLLLGVSPLVTAMLIFTMVSITKMANSLEDGTYSELMTATSSLIQYCSEDLDKNYDNSYIDCLKNNGIELTLFKDNERILTSIYKDNTNERNIGTKADEAIYQDVKNGNIVKKDKVTIGGDKYYVVYQPIYDKDGNFWGMAFAGEKQKAVDTVVLNSILSLINIAFCLMFVFTFIIVLIAIKVKKPMINASNSLIKLSSGDLNNDINFNSSIFEVSSIIEATKSLQKNLKNAISLVKDSSDTLGVAVSEIDDKVEVTAENVVQINTAINEVSDTSQTVAVSAQSLNMKADELGKNVEELTENVTILTKEAEEIKQANLEATEYMNIVLDSSNTSVASVNDIVQEIKDTNEAVKEIQSCINMINEIASETKLLSLNASIESAHAGEAGKGFAVVAQNIKELAESSSENVNKIVGIINKVTKLSNESVNGAEKVKDTIEKEKKYIADTQEKFKVLSNAVDNSIEEISSISEKTKSLEELKTGLISDTSDLGAMSEELGASAEEVSASCAEVSGMCQENRAKTQEMRAVNDCLVEAISFFSL